MINWSIIFWVGIFSRFKALLELSFQDREYSFDQIADDAKNVAIIGKTRTTIVSCC